MKQVAGDDDATRALLHGAVGCLGAAGQGGDCGSGALGGSGAVALNLLLDQLQGVNGSELTATEKEARSNLVASLLAGAAAASGGDAGAAGTAGRLEMENNYLTPQATARVKDCLNGTTCATQEERRQVVAEAERLSKLLDRELTRVCADNPTGDACRTATDTALRYIAMDDAWQIMPSDAGSSSRNTFEHLYNSDGADERFTFYLRDIDKRYSFFYGSHLYEQNEGLGAQWYGGAAFVSNAPVTGLGADGHGSWFTFGMGALLAPVYEWRNEAGETLLQTGFNNFQALYNQAVADPVAWDIKQLGSEQAALQSVHEKYLGNRSAFVKLTSFATNAEGLLYNNYFGIGLDERQGMPGGVKLIDYSSRMEYGCRLLGYGQEQGCVP